MMKLPMSGFDGIALCMPPQLSLPDIPQSGGTVSSCVAQVSLILIDNPASASRLLDYTCVPLHRVILFLLFCFVLLSEFLTLSYSPG